MAFDSFATDDATVGDLIAGWIKEKPNSFAAHLALGCYFSWRGWHTRGNLVANQTASAQFDRMRSYFDESADDTKSALKIRPKLSIAYTVLLSQARGEGDRQLQQTIECAAVQAIPASFVIREEAMECLYPRWGGNHELMATFAQQSQAQVEENPYMHWLLGFVDGDEGAMSAMHDDLDKSIEQWTRAIDKGGDYSGFYFGRGESFSHLGLFEEALGDFDRANDLSPQDPELLIRRADTLARLGRPKEALADLKFVAIFEAPDEFSTQLHDWVVSAMKQQH